MIIVLLPVYNEEGNIGKLLERFISLKSCGEMRFVLVNDGSRDRSEKIIRSYANRLSLILINHKKNKGVTEALKTGFNEIMKFLNSDDLVITMDSDNTHDPCSIVKIVEKFNQGYDIINGSRFCEGGKMIGVPIYRLFFSYACRFILTRVFPMGEIRDYSVFYRGYRGRLIREAVNFYGDRLFQTEGFVGLPELLIKLSRFHPRTVEVPLVVRYDFKIGASKMRIAKALGNYLYMIYLLKRQGL
jgi:dolichol-phosphate mannosyltransferase